MSVQRYALEDYNKAVALYEQLVSNSKEPAPELKTNYLAALSLANATDQALTYISKHQARGGLAHFPSLPLCSALPR